MTDERQPPSRSIRRILVALDASPHSLAALESAADLAAAFKAELRGLFVEDINLIRMSDLSVAREVRSFTQPAQSLSERRLSLQLKRQAERAEQALQSIAQRMQVESSFEVTRGAVARSLLDAAQDVDLITLGKTSQSWSSRRKLGSTARALLSEATRPVLVLSEVLRPDQPIIVYYDGSDAAESALKFAASLAYRSDRGSLTVLLPTDDSDETQRLHDQVVERFAHTVAPLRVRPLTPLEATRLAAATHAEGNGLVVLPAGCPPLCDIDLQQFLYEVDSPVLIAR
jgi:nucleotide-binding universal stress UspA family protein